MLSCRTLEGSQLDEWFDFVGKVFAPKADREYFERHFFNDPHRCVESIFMASKVNNNEILGTVRVFHREILTRTNKVMIMGGIGEVSTRSDMRGHGIASSLLKHAYQSMQDNKFEIASLHCSPSLVKFYSSVGYHSTPMHFSLVELSLCGRSNGLEEEQLSQVSFSIDLMPNLNDSPSMVQQMSQLYHSFIRENDFCGTVMRTDEQYWRLWVNAEARTHNSTPLVSLDPQGKLLGYMFIHPIENTNVVNVKEFAAEKHVDQWSLFSELLAHYMAKHPTCDQIANEDVPRVIRVKMPLPLFKLFGIQIGKIVQWHRDYFLKVESVVETHASDIGYMYQVVTKESPDLCTRELADMFPEQKCVMWKTDGF